jgi:ankyrin repeat protein
MSVVDVSCCCELRNGDSHASGAVCDCAREQNGRTALLCACVNGHLHVAQWLVTSAGSDFRSDSERDNVGRSCVASLGFCGRGDDPRGSRVLCAWQLGHTALLLAAALGHVDVVQWLVTSVGSGVRSERNNVRR